MPSDAVVEEFLECIELNQDAGLCYNMYKGLDDDGTLKRIKECLERCVCYDDDKVAHGEIENDEEFCRDNCGCIEPW